MQSRYYNPEWGRFLNADSFVSTGQGLLGSNMFAYCGNNPIAFSDPSGHYYAGTIDNEFAYAFCDKECGGGGAGSLTGVLGAAGAAAGTAVIISAPTIGNWLSTYFYNMSSEVRLYARCLMDQYANKYADHQPRIHHVIPQGDFSHFGDDTVMYINEMHAILNSVGININDPENLVIISQGTHKSMHTKHYFACIYEIMITAEPGNEASVRWALYLARTYASSLDRFPKGY